MQRQSGNHLGWKRLLRSSRLIIKSMVQLGVWKQLIYVTVGYLRVSCRSSAVTSLIWHDMERPKHAGENLGKAFPSVRTGKKSYGKERDRSFFTVREGEMRFR